MRFFIAFILLIGVLQLNAQHKGSIAFAPVWKQEKVVKDGAYILPKHDAPITITRLRWYISDFTFMHKGKPVLKLQQRFYLMDLEDPESMVIAIPEMPKKYDEVRFNLGIDSTTNASGVHGDDLDPTKGMYWTWQSGYINFKLEGQSDLCPNERKAFTYHLGGYSGKFNSLQTISLKTSPEKNLRIFMYLDQLLTETLLKETASIMKPGETAVATSAKVAKIFVIKQ